MNQCWCDDRQESPEEEYHHNGSPSTHLSEKEKDRLLQLRNSWKVLIMRKEREKRERDHLNALSWPCLRCGVITIFIQNSVGLGLLYIPTRKVLSILNYDILSSTG